jgi:hypothetical protein
VDAARRGDGFGAVRSVVDALTSGLGSIVDRTLSSKSVRGEPTVPGLLTFVVALAAIAFLFSYWYYSGNLHHVPIICAAAAVAHTLMEFCRRMRMARESRRVVACDLRPVTAARLWWLQACCAVADGAVVSLPRRAVAVPSSPDESSRCPPAVCVAAVLGDSRHRMSILGGREGMPRSLGSVYGCAVTLFLHHPLKRHSGTVSTSGRSYRPATINMAVGASMRLLAQADGDRWTRRYLTVLASGRDARAAHDYQEHAIHELYAVGSRPPAQVTGKLGDEPLEFNDPRQVWVTSDAFTFVAEYSNNRVQVLTPRRDFHAFVGAGLLDGPDGVCANADVVVVSEMKASRITVFGRGDGALRRRFGARGSGNGELSGPARLCFLADDRHVAVADQGNDRVTVFSVDGEFIRHVGVGVLRNPVCVMPCSEVDELVVADSVQGGHANTLRRRFVLFGPHGELLTSIYEPDIHRFCTPDGELGVSPNVLMFLSSS